MILQWTLLKAGAGSGILCQLVAIMPGFTILYHDRHSSKQLAGQKGAQQTCNKLDL